ncbi:hypothetical protein [Novosphingobium mangrovi (ex Hu et al. 2023)]|uniref:Glycosyltransferase RgtA/B/C/D-like domain-containing protein n=1 Tax=Novosphingobium mangrovi (ex Hu et al. 2023) TaxID=2930094 RepID=A0ABT0AEV3_9SPHN|nr:hypothetical protein [Novosphingobium mangrovi (ex Hu et al. 2023)]MCJ1961709.1 hypothetical protein [Novosphingobium mangrovi (ex Hu et al. 2023)]
MSAEIIHFPTQPTRAARRLEWFAQQRSVLLAIGALYFGLRVGALFFDIAVPPEAQWHHETALALAVGGGYFAAPGDPAIFTPIGWPMVLSLAYARFGASAVTLGLFNLANALAIGGLTLALGRRLFANEAAARSGLLLLAISPLAVTSVPLAGPGLFLTALVLSGCWLVVVRTNRWHLVSAGLVFALAALTEPASLLVPALVFVLDALRAPFTWRRFGGVLGEGVLVLGIALLATTPWTWRYLDHPEAFLARVPAAVNLGEILTRLGTAQLAWSALILAASASALMVALLQRRGPGWWILPYAVLLGAALAPAPNLLAAALTLLCLPAGGFTIWCWQRIAERRPKRPQ